MATEYCGFGDKPVTKRKRAFEDLNEHASQEALHVKRPNLTQLPIRTSPVIAPYYTWHNPILDIQQPLTPVDSSDDECHGQAENVWSQHRVAASSRTRPSGYRVPLATIARAVGDEMDLESETGIRSRKRNVSPNGNLSLLHVPMTVLEERTPTPISAKFNLFHDSAKSRSRHIVHHTALSPMMIEEAYLPSPVDSDDMMQNPDAETTMRMDHASNGFGALSVACRDDDVMGDAEHEGSAATLGIAKHSRSSKGRHAKLHMGFLADCEKCQQRVPGHYSHIIWS